MLARVEVSRGEPGQLNLLFEILFSLPELCVHDRSYFVIITSSASCEKIFFEILTKLIIFLYSDL